MILLGNGDAPSDEIKELVLPVLAFVHALRLQLRSGGDIQEAKRFLPAEAHAAFERSANKPNQALLWLGEQLRLARAKNRLSEYGLIELARLLTDLSDSQGGCERIKNTPIPHSYTILIHQIVGLYVLALPFALVSTLHLATPLVTLAIAYTFLGLDALGDEIEDPFGYDYNDLPLSAICRTIEVNLLEALSETDIPPLSRPERGVLL
jgi:putative membrane protein